MTLAADIANDWQQFDGVETVTVAANGTAIDDAKGLQSATDRMDIAMLGSIGLEADTTVWTVWTATLGGATIRNGDKITDGDGNGWIVRQVSLKTLGTRFRCVCVKER